jgi:hypothetical protein
LREPLEDESPAFAGLSLWLRGRDSNPNFLIQRWLGRPDQPRRS